MEAKLRKHRSRLKISGYAVIAFGLWSIIRIFLMRYFDPLSFEAMLGEETDIPREFYDEVVFTGLLVFLAFYLLYRFFVGRAAIREGSGNRRKMLYVFFALLYGLISVCGDIHYTVLLFSQGGRLIGLTDILVDLSACVAMFEIVYSAAAIRVLEKKAREVC